ncbi:MAG: hypothetical protein ACPLVI_06630 [Thermoplasmata archaeon]
MPRIEIAENPDEIRKGVEVIKQAWGVTDMSTIMKDLLTAIKFTGGLVLLAYEGDQVVGISFSLLAQRNRNLFLYSHMTGVIPEFRKTELGYSLKLRQREWAMEKGFDLVAWTFDPLQGLNSNFNLHKLGAIARTYRKNHYGTMMDSLNFGIPSDRVVAEWYVLSGHVKSRLNREYNSYGELPQAIITEEKGDYRIPKDIDLTLSDDYILIEIPRDINTIKKKNLEDAINWRIMTSDVYQHYFARGYVLMDFFTRDGRNFQVATRILPQGVKKKTIF